MHIGLTMPINSPSAGGRFDSDRLDAGVKEESRPGTKWIRHGTKEDEIRSKLYYCYEQLPADAAILARIREIRLTFQLLMYFGAQELLVREKINALFSSWFPFFVVVFCFESIPKWEELQVMRSLRFLKAPKWQNSHAYKQNGAFLCKTSCQKHCLWMRNNKIIFSNSLMARMNERICVCFTNGLITASSHACSAVVVH